MKIEVFSDDESAARAAAKFVAAEAAAAVAARGLFVMAVSGGRTPWIMLRALGNEKVQWERIHIVQVDERIAPAANPDRNLMHLRESLLDHSPIRPEQIHAMPVESPDLEGAAQAVCLAVGRDRRLAANAGSGPPGPWARRTYRVFGAWGTGS